jgi:hypothetical protein
VKDVSRVGEESATTGRAGPQPKGFGRYGDRLCTEPGCDRRLYYLGKGLCLKHGTAESARDEMRRVIAAFATPHPLNRALFDAYAGSLDPASAGVAAQRIASALAAFLARHEVPAPFTWEYLEGLDPTALGYKRSTADLILTGLRRAAGRLSAFGGSGVETLSSYKSRRAALAPLGDTPAFLRAAAEGYALHLWGRQSSDRNVGHSLEAVRALGRWCELAGLRRVTELQPQMLTLFQRSLCYHRRCVTKECGTRLPYDGRPLSNALECPSCGGRVFERERRAGSDHVRLVCYRVRAFLEWARERRLVVFNAAAGFSLPSAAEAVRRHLGEAEEAAVVAYMKSARALTAAAIAIYLFRFHGLKVVELRRALIPPDARPGAAGRKSLAECFKIVIPPPERGAGAGGPAREIPFLEEARPWLEPALVSYGRGRESALGPNYSPHFFTSRCGDSGPAGAHYFDDLLEEASAEVFDDGGVLTPAMLRAAFTDALLRLGGSSGLRAGSTSRARGYQYLPAPRVPAVRRRRRHADMLDQE